VADLHDLTALEQLAALRLGDVTPRELAEHYLARIERRNPELGALVEVTAQAALARADALLSDALRSAESRDAPLWGLPFADKDLVARAGVPTRYGSRVFANNVPEQSDALALVFDDAGAISLGKTNTPEFGLTGYTESLVAAPARDPWNLSLGAGGSSGGAAVAVAAGLLPLAPASDGGGSIRIPAATVGVVGLKPSRGRLPIGSGIDGVGGLVVYGGVARSVADVALLLDALAASGPYRYAVRAPDDGPFLGAALAGEGRYRIGVTTVSPWDDDEDIVLHPTARSAVDRAVAQLTALGHTIEEATWNPRGYAEFFRTLWWASAARVRVPDAQLALLEPITSWLVRQGRKLSGDDLSIALAAATAFERSTIGAFEHFDAVLTPALALPPRPVGWFDANDPERNFSQQVRYAPYSSFVNVAGLPALVLPVDEDEGGHPLSVQLIGRPGGERILLEIAGQLERQLLSPRRHPEGW
jgi:amidase